MLFSGWTHTAVIDSFETVLPDGCQDILIVEEPGLKPTLVLTDWDHSARTVRLSSGKKLTGFRLRPGLTVDPLDIQELEPSADEVVRFVLGEADPNTAACELIEALSGNNRSMQDVARQIGVRLRTLQRRLRSLGLPAPDYWRMLSRARAAANELPYGTPLVEIANANGYGDQAHMSREFLRWFGVTPAQMRRNTALVNDVSQPGLGNWTFEQISIK